MRATHPRPLKRQNLKKGSTSRNCGRLTSSIALEIATDGLPGRKLGPQSGKSLHSNKEGMYCILGSMCDEVRPVWPITRRTL